MFERAERARRVALVLGVVCLAVAPRVTAQPPPQPVEPAPSPAQPAPAAPAPAQPPSAQPAPAQPVEEPVAEERAEEPAEDEGSERSDTGIDGVVIDASTNEPIIEGAVQVVGRDIRVYTDIDGNFSIDIRPGRYTLRSFYDLFQPARLENVVVERGERTRVEIRLTPDSESIQEVVVTARADTATAATQLTIRREATAVRDSVSAEEISRSPDSSASDAARRVVAATVVGRYLFVRGLGGRYTNVLLNGAELPSTDPDVPGVQLDLFPAALLNSIAIVKTFTPDLPGNFAGGSMLITTRDFPSRFTMGASLSLGFNSTTTFGNMLDYEGGDLDFLGVDDGTRALPESVPDARLESRSGRFTAEQVDAVGRDFPNIWGLGTSMALPNLRIGFNAGDTVELGDRFLGYLVAISYSLANDSAEETLRRVTADDDGGVQLRDTFTRTTGSTDVILGALGASTLELSDGHQLSLSTLFTQTAEDYAGFKTGMDDRMGRAVAERRLGYLQRTVWSNQLGGDHRGLFGGWRAQWRLNLSLGHRAEPDVRDLRYHLLEVGPRWDNNPGSGERFFSELDQLDLGSGADVHIPLSMVTLRGGGAASTSGRTYETRRFAYDRPRGASTSHPMLGPDLIFADEQVGPNVTLAEETSPADSYRSRQNLIAAYAMLDVPLTDSLRVVGGARAEALNQVVESNSPFAEQAAASVPPTHRTDVDILPAGSVVLALSEQMFLRAAYGRTVARPQIRELAPFRYSDFIRDREVIGNPQLDRTVIQNFDVRWELFPSENEVLAVSLFAKLFEDAIEMTVLDRNDLYGFQNLSSATNLGAEIEGRVGLDRVTDSLRSLSVGANLTLVQSRVTLTDEEAGLATTHERPLAGQSPYVANLSLGFAPPETGFEAFVYYNVFGRRLVEVGRLGIPDIYEQPFHSLDVVARYELGEHLSLKAAVRNLLFQRNVLDQGGIAVREYEEGLSASIQLGWSN